MGPTNRQLADALTKDAADPVDLLRSCMRSGEYQLSPEHIMSERQQSDPGASNDRCPLNLRHYRVSRPSHQLLSWLNKGSVLNVPSQPTRSVSWSFFHPWALQRRSFLESLDSEHASSVMLSRSRSQQPR